MFINVHHYERCFFFSKFCLIKNENQIYRILRNSSSLVDHLDVFLQNHFCLVQYYFNFFGDHIFASLIASNNWVNLLLCALEHRPWMHPGYLTKCYAIVVKLRI